MEMNEKYVGNVGGCMLDFLRSSSQLNFSRGKEIGDVYKSRESGFR